MRFSMLLKRPKNIRLYLKRYVGSLGKAKKKNAGTREIKNFKYLNPKNQ